MKQARQQKQTSGKTIAKATAGKAATKTPLNQRKISPYKYAKALSHMHQLERLEIDMMVASSKKVAMTS